jgi:iron complex transport system permease protein
VSEIDNVSKDHANLKNKRIKTILSFVIIILMLIILFFISVNIGSLKVSFKTLMRGLFIKYNPDVATIYDLRFPRIIISMLAGAAIAVSGVLFQAVLKNPLADPGIIGISSGAGFAAVCITAFAPTLYFFTPVAACFGGIAAFIIVYVLSWKGGLSPLRIILTGVAVEAFFSGTSSVINSMSGGDRTGVASIVEGNITQKTWDDVYTLLPYVIVGLALSIVFVGRCNLLSLEDKTARSLGVNVNRSRMLISIIAVILASISTAVVGAISFLGLIVPHIGRILVGSDHKKLVPFSIFAGAFTFLFADTIGRTICRPYEVNAAVVMSVIGGPFFILLLRGKK